MNSDSKLKRLMEEINALAKKISVFKLSDVPKTRLSYKPLFSGTASEMEKEIAVLEKELDDLREKKELCQELQKEISRTAGLSRDRKKLILSLLKKESTAKRNLNEPDPASLLADLKRSAADFLADERLLKAKVVELREDLQIEIKKEEFLARAELEERVRHEVESKKIALEESRRAWKEFRKELEKLELLLDEYRLIQEEEREAEKIENLRGIIGLG